MADLWDQIRSLFKKVEHSSPSQPATHELITRPSEEQQDYQKWVDTLVRRRLQDWLADQYAIFRVAPDDVDESLDFLDTPSSKGFVVHFHRTRYSKRDVQHFFDFLKAQVLKLDYRTQISDRRTYARPDWVETVERHYLKPRPSQRKEGKFHQAFGNVTIENLLRNDEVYHLKFRATTYRDHQFHPAEEFTDLMQQLLV